MKAAMRDRYGGPDVVELREVPTPVPSGDQVLVKVHAASVNRADLDGMRPKAPWLRLFYGLRRPRIRTLGLDVAGVVDMVGPEATQLKVGDRVFADLYSHGQAAFAEYVCASERAFATIPAGVSFDAAATLPHAALLAVQSMKPRVGQSVGPGTSLMIVGASGNVGPFAVQIAKALGAEVTGVCRTSKIDFVRSLGADHVIDYTTTDYTTTGPYDRIVDVDAHRSIIGYVKALRPGGVYLALGGTSLWLLSWAALAPVRRWVAPDKHLGLMLGWRPFHPDDVATLTGLLEHGIIQPRIDRRYPLSQIVRALQDVDRGEVQGKVVVTVSE